ncbi:DUF4430 domain-containing protein [Eubacterium sp.]|uniref:DUF4430 domain-containing protein n=1 Tax=Eubacterium sp. TaxID=142586 RepID=UPI0025ECD2FA|nr:DUF4430 domain-containing protein [Eubacterium sp.]MCR5628941.1 DUF4430 domain-containing protein [Eubacterium sp.]
MDIKRFFAKIIIVVLIINSIFINNGIVASADESIDVYFTCEKSIIGQGLIIEPCKISVSNNTRVSEVLDKVLKKNNVSYVHNGTLTDGFYLSRIKNCDDGTFNIPEIIKNSDVYNRRVSSNNVNSPDLAERSFIGTSGWYYFVNNSAPNVGMSDYKVSDGDVIRIQFTLFGFGEDLKIPANRDKLIITLANNKDSDYYKDGIKILKNFDKDKDDIKTVIEKINPVKNDKQDETNKNENGNKNDTSNNNQNNNQRDEKYQNDTNNNGNDVDNNSNNNSRRRNRNRNNRNTSDSVNNNQKKTSNNNNEKTSEK